MLGRTLAVLTRNEGLELQRTRRSFVFDILLAYSCRENGAVLVSRNARDMHPIAELFAFEFAAPFPGPASL